VIGFSTSGKDGRLLMDKGPEIASNVLYDNMQHTIHPTFQDNNC